MTKRDPKKAVGYTRVSTTKQADEGVSLDAQRDQLETYAKLQGISLIEIISDEGVSAFKPMAERPGASRILEILNDPASEVGSVMTVKLDRLFRNTADALTHTLEWDRAGVSLCIIDMGGSTLDTSTPMGRMMLTMMVGFAELERGLTVERTLAAINHRRSKGQRYSANPPWGFLVDENDGLTLVEHHNRRNAIQSVKTWHSAGVSKREIARRVTSRYGIQMFHGAVTRVLEEEGDQ